MASCGHSGLAFDDGGRCHYCAKVHAGYIQTTGDVMEATRRELVQKTQWSKWQGEGRNRSRRKVGTEWVKEETR